MGIWQHINTLPLYISYFFNKVDEHSLHPPFVYNFYTKVIRGDLAELEDQAVESWRKKLLDDATIADGNDMGAGSRQLNANAYRISAIAKKGISSSKECIRYRKICDLLATNSVLELGTSVGIATAYLARSALVKEIFTIEGNTTLAQYATRLWKDLDCQTIKLMQGDIDHILKETISEMKEVDLAIIDANHQQAAVLSYYHTIQPYMTDKGCMIIDDIRWSRDMYRGWKKLLQIHDISCSIELMDQGILFFDASIPRQHYVL